MAAITDRLIMVGFVESGLLELRGNTVRKTGDESLLRWTERGSTTRKDAGACTDWQL